MAKYSVRFTETAIKDLGMRKRSVNKANMKKIFALVKELEDHPFSGQG